MTVREEAYGLIDQLSEESVRAVIQIMVRMAPARKKEQVDTSVLSPKKKAFLELQEMRKEAAKYHFSENERASSLESKYGDFPWNGGAE